MLEVGQDLQEEILASHQDLEVLHGVYRRGNSWRGVLAQVFGKRALSKVHQLDQIDQRSGPRSTGFTGSAVAEARAVSDRLVHPLRRDR